MFAIRTIQLLLFFEILLLALARYRFSYGRSDAFGIVKFETFLSSLAIDLLNLICVSCHLEPCVPKTEFTCGASKSSHLSTYPCVRLNYLCDNYNDCSNGKDEICDGRLHIPTGICQRESDLNNFMRMPFDFKKLTYF